MIEIDEIISNAEFCANEYKKFSEIAPERSLTFKKYEEDHRQLAEWLKDYKRLKEQEPCEDWNDTPSGEMTLEQARQAVRELRKYVMDNHILSKSEDAISRQYLIDKAVSWDKHYADSERYVSLLDIQNAPPVITPQPKMKIGKWIIMDIEDCELFMAKCSECGVIVDSRMISKYLYCHYCGAKMVESQERSDKE